MLLELFIGGAGRLINIGSLTLRMYLFIGAFLLLPILIFKGYILNPISKIVLIFFTILFSWSIINGLIHNAETTRIIDDAKMASFFFILPFFDFLINDRKTVNIIVKLLKFSSLLMALMYISILIALLVGLTNFQELYMITSKEDYADEIAFRGEGAIMYKGFAYMCIGFFFFLFEKKSIWKFLSCAVILIAIILTLTRGLIVTIGLITIPYFIYQNIYKRKNIVLGVMSLLIILISLLYSLPLYLETLGDKAESDIVRTIQITQVVERIDWNSWLIGHGYGIGVPIGVGHLEITYLEVFHKQGLFGLIYWFSLLVLLFFLYMRTSVIDRNFTTPLFFSVLFLYIESATNPFLINSIGLTLIFIALITFYKIPIFGQ